MTWIANHDDVTKGWADEWDRGVMPKVPREPDAWSAFIDVDRSTYASAIEHTLDVALDAVPELAAPYAGLAAIRIAA